MPKAKQHYVLAWQNLPVRMPFWQTVTTCLVLDRINATVWLDAVAVCVLVFAWALYFTDLFRNTRHITIEEILDNNKEPDDAKNQRY